LISNYHVVKDATKVRLLTSAGLIDAKVVPVDAANDLALLKADGRFAPLPIAASGTVATVGFGLRSASGNSGAQTERRLERSRSATPPLSRRRKPAAEPNLPRFKAESAGGGIDAGQRLVGSYRDYMAMGL
jgi:hypothetical protein